MKKILIAGLGNLGTRYLEGISRISDNKIVHILEPNEQAIERANLAVAAHTQITKVSIDALSPSYDLCVVATSSGPRTALVEKIAEKSDVQAWILEKILAQSPAQLERIRVAVGNSPAWVNTPRRLTDIYRKIKKAIGGNKIQFSVQNSDFALACNSIHFIDTVSWLTGETLTDVGLQLVSGWYDAKRPGYKEFDGKLTATFSSGSVLEISNTKEINYPGIRITSLGRNSEFQIEINETEGFAIDGQFHTGRLEYQSELTPALVRGVLTDGTAGIPTLRESILQHEIFLSAVKNNPQLAAECADTVPIT